jgi:two-component system NtrC family response regulator
VALIESHSWPGNVRELENCIRRAVIMAEQNHISAADIGLKGTADELPALNLRQIRESAERRAVVTALGRVDGNIVKASELLGVSRPTLYDLMNRLGIK